jgi:hypothetical protein
MDAANSDISISALEQIELVCEEFEAVCQHDSADASVAGLLE